MTFKAYQQATGSGKITLINEVVTIDEDYLFNKIVNEIIDNAFPPTIDINTPVVVNSEKDENYNLNISFSMDYAGNYVILNRFEGSISDEDCREYPFSLRPELEKRIVEEIYSKL